MQWIRGIAEHFHQLVDDQTDPALVSLDVTVPYLPENKEGNCQKGNTEKNQTLLFELKSSCFSFLIYLIN